MNPAPPAAAPDDEPALICIRFSGHPDDIATVMAVVRTALGHTADVWVAVRGDAAELNAVLERQGWPTG